jgi:hypothetical protein
MEFALLPFYRGNPPIPIPRTPYISKERYDGGPWVSYPSRRGKLLSVWDGKNFNLQEYHRSERVNPTPLLELEPFVQTWLYFGLLSEFLCVNISEVGLGTLAVGEQEFKTIVDRIYDATLLQDGDGHYVSLTSDCLNSFLQSTRPRLPQDPEIKKRFYEHLNLCLSCTKYMLVSLPAEFNHSVKCSIAALAELLMHTVNTAFQLLGLKPEFGRFWGKDFLDKEAKRAMKDRGWCVSDISRLEAKYKSVQGLYVARMMDKSLPSRNHENCTEFVCRYFQINMGAFQLQHQGDGCLCEALQVDNDELTRMLRKDDTFPLLRLTGDLYHLKAELIESKSDVAYVAISHVWADGLGNPNSNSLHRCKLHYLREVVASIDNHDIGNENNAPFIWLDTLCCPAEDGDGKQLAIEKIRVVYQNAKHVLVLDAGLMSYSVSEQDEFEQLVRIYTSGWMRRLWTLQEGALAKSLYFQFADKAVSIVELMNNLFKKCNHMKYKAIFTDLWGEYQGLVSFFHQMPGVVGLNKLATLDQSLQFRSVSVPTDEALCIGTLLSLNLYEVLNVKEKGHRMQKVWELIAAKKGGLPMQIIFFQEPRINAPGWRWAPQSLLTWPSGSHELVNTRILKWNEPRLGKITYGGLRVQYSGYRIKIATEDGKRKPQLLPGYPRLPEFNLFFRDSETGEWYRIFDKAYGYLNQIWTDEERKAHHELGLFPLHDIAESGDSGLLFNSSIGSISGIREALFGTIVINQSLESLEDGLAVRTGHVVEVALARPESAYMFDTLRRLAIDLRNDDLAEKHMEIYTRLAEDCRDSPDLLKTATENSDEVKTSVKQIRDKMKRMVEEAAAEDDKFVKAVQDSGEVGLESVWVWIYDFVAHDYVGQKIEEQVWFVD